MLATNEDIIHASMQMQLQVFVNVDTSYEVCGNTFCNATTHKADLA